MVDRNDHVVLQIPFGGHGAQSACTQQQQQNY